MLNWEKILFLGGGGIGESYWIRLKLDLFYKLGAGGRGVRERENWIWLKSANKSQINSKKIQKLTFFLLVCLSACARAWARASPRLAPRLAAGGGGT